MNDGNGPLKREDHETNPGENNEVNRTFPSGFRRSEHWLRGSRLTKRSLRPAVSVDSGAGWLDLAAGFLIPMSRCSVLLAGDGVDDEANWTGAIEKPLVG